MSKFNQFCDFLARIDNTISPPICTTGKYVGIGVGAGAALTVKVGRSVAKVTQVDDFTRGVVDGCVEQYNKDMEVSK